jgi:hypothetical protein
MAYITEGPLAGSLLSRVAFSFACAMLGLSRHDFSFTVDRGAHCSTAADEGGRGRGHRHVQILIQDPDLERLRKKRRFHVKFSCQWGQAHGAKRRESVSEPLEVDMTTGGLIDPFWGKKM